MDLGKFALGFVVGAAVGAAASYIFFKEKFRTNAEEEIAEMREYVKEKLNNRKELEQQGKRIEEQGKRIEKVVRNYNSSSSADRASEIYIRKSEMEHPKESKEIYRISSEQFADVDPEFDKITLTFYSDDGVLVDDVDERVDGGDTIGHDNFRIFDTEDLNEMYVRNEKTSTDYEVIRVLGSYREMVGDI